MIFFSKYDIFKNDEIYDEEVYNDYLTEEEFKKTLIWYREKLERIYCFKYPSNYLPKCINDINKSNTIDDEVKIYDIFNSYNTRNIYLYKKENGECKVLDYSHKNYKKI